MRLAQRSSPSCSSRAGSLGVWARAISTIWLLALPAPTWAGLAEPPAAVSSPGESTTDTSLAVSARRVPADDQRDENIYRQHIMLLADPFMEGRGPGTHGNRIAADYLEFHFKRLGLAPAFVNAAPSGKTDVVDKSAPEGASYFQPFEAGKEAIASQSALALSSPGSSLPIPFDVGSDYTVLGFSSDADIKDADLVFVGYSLEHSGKDEGEYSSYAENDDLTGKVAVLLRFEPMDDQGKSLWRSDKTGGGWSGAAGLSGKLQSAMKRGAAGILVVNTPGADDTRVHKLDSTAGSANWSRKLDIPVFMLSSEAGEKIVKACDAQHRDLLTLRKLADGIGSSDANAPKPGAIALSAGKVSLSARVERKPRITWNVGGLLQGKGSLKNEVVVIGAHYDHVGYGFTGGSRNSEYGVIHPGADDNASGTSGMLLSADLLSQVYKLLPENANARSILFLGFSAEEMGLIGSRYFVKNPPYEASKLYAMLNMDMIGRYMDGWNVSPGADVATERAGHDQAEADAKRRGVIAEGAGLELGGVGTADGFKDIVASVFEPSGLKLKYSPGGRGPSDHASFYSAGVPVLFVFTGLHDQYHTPRDVASLINVPGAVRIARAVSNTALVLAQRAEPLKFTSTDKSKPGAPAQDTSMKNVKVRFGIAPGNYAEGEEGVLVGEVFANTSAAAAGIKEGDRLLKWNGQDIGDVANWMSFLSQHKPGDIVEVTLKRKDGATETIPVTLKAREQMDQ